MAAELRKLILEADDLKSEVLDIPEWNVKVEVRALSGRERARLFKAATGADGSVDMERWMLDLVLATTFDPEDGTKVFELADRDHLAAKSGAALQRIHDKAAQLSGLAPSAIEEAKEVFDEAQSSASTSN